MAPQIVSCCGWFVGIPLVVALVAALSVIFTINPQEIVKEAVPNHLIHRPLVPRPHPQERNVDAFILFDGSSSMTKEDFEQDKRVGLAYSARLQPDAQLGVIQFGAKAQVHHKLSTQRAAVEEAIINMKQLGGPTNLDDALHLARREMALSAFPNNTKEIWIFTTGNYETPYETALTAQKLKREYHATIYVIGVGAAVSKSMIDRIATDGCSFLVENFEAALSLMKKNIRRDSLSVQTQLEILLPYRTNKLGEKVKYSLKLENVGEEDIGTGSRIVFHENSYFKPKTVTLKTTLRVRTTQIIEVELVPKILGSRNLEEQITNIPPVLEFSILDSKGNEITVDCTGYLVQHEHFIGNLLEFLPVYEWEPFLNILLFGPPGAGAAGDSRKMERLAEVYSQFTVDMKRKAIVVISKADQIPGEQERKATVINVTNTLGIGSHSLYFLENYVDDKEKQFHLDKQILRILLAMLNRGNDFLVYEHQNPIASPYGAPPQLGTFTQAK